MLKGSQFRTRKIEESFLPACRWILNEEGKWRNIIQVENHDSSSSYSHYEEAIVFPLKIELPAYNEIDYETNFKSLNWSKDETDLLWKLCVNFSLNFLIIHDRFNYEMKLKRPIYEFKTLEEIKERYFEIYGKISGEESKFKYEKEFDSKRRMILESYHARPIEQSLEECFVVDYLTKLQLNGELSSRLSERIEIIKMLAGEQFTAGWPTLPELLKIASGKGVARLTEKNKNKKNKKKRKKVILADGSSSSSEKKNSNSGSNVNINDRHVVTKTTLSSSTSTSTSASASSNKKSKSTSHSSGNIYLTSSRIHPLRVGSARAVEKILADLNLSFKPELPTKKVVQKFDQLRSMIVQLIDARKGAGLAPSKSLESAGAGGEGSSSL